MYIMAINIIDRGNYNINVIEEYTCNSKTELQTRERWWIENNECINKIIPGRTPKERYQANKVEILAQRKKYRENNTEIIKSKKSEKFTCNCGGKYTRCNYSQHCKTEKHQDYLTTLT